MVAGLWSSFVGCEVMVCGLIQETAWLAAQRHARMPESLLMRVPTSLDSDVAAYRPIKGMARKD